MTCHNKTTYDESKSESQRNALLNLSNRLKILLLHTLRNIVNSCLDSQLIEHLHFGVPTYPVYAYSTVV